MEWSFCSLQGREEQQTSRDHCWAGGGRWWKYSACTRVLLASSQALKSSRGCGAKPKGWVVGAGSNTRAMGALKGGGVASQHLHCHSPPGSVFLALQLQCPSLARKLLRCSCARKSSAAPWVNLIFSLESAGIGRRAVSLSRFRSGLLRPSPPGCGLCDSAKTSKFVHKVCTG